MVGISIVLLFRVRHSMISFIIVIMWVYGRTSTICMSGRAFYTVTSCFCRIPFA